MTPWTEAYTAKRLAFCPNCGARRESLYEAINHHFEMPEQCNAVRLAGETGALSGTVTQYRGGEK
jgi:hypothetical protein